MRLRIILAQSMEFMQASVVKLTSSTSYASVDFGDNVAWSLTIHMMTWIHLQVF